VHGNLVEKETTMSHLGEPLVIGPLRLANRIVMPPLVTFRAGHDGTVTPVLMDHYRQSRGAGLVVVEATAVSPEGRLGQAQIGAFEDRHVEGLAELARIIHENGSVAAIQIHHAGGSTSTTSTFGLPLVAPSSVPTSKGEIPLALDEEGIQRIIACYAEAARRAREAGFDAVELHFAHGYLGSQFLSPYTNLRTDRWGGSLENRARFLRDALARVREAVGTALAVYCRLGVADGRPGGLSLDEGIQVAKWLEADGMPLLHISHGVGGPPITEVDEDGSSPLLGLGKAVKKAVAIPVIGVGDVYTPDQAEAAIARGFVDLIAVGRGILADPQWASKTISGKPQDIYLCRRCKHCHHFGHSELCPALTARARGKPPGA
jgi:NADPH2 dehydrogenase